MSVTNIYFARFYFRDLLTSEYRMVRLFTSGKTKQKRTVTIANQNIGEGLLDFNHDNYVPSVNEDFTHTAASALNKTNTSMLSYPTKKSLYKALAALLFFMAFGLSNSVAQDIDLKMTQTVNTTLPQLGDSLVYSVYVKNESLNNASGVEVKDQTPFGALSGITVSTAAGSFVYNAADGEITWNIGSLNAGDSVKLEIKAAAIARGIFYNTAEVTAADQTDTDSTPGNNSVAEDDFVTSCHSIPVYWYPGDNFLASIPAPYASGTGIKWFKNGIEIDAFTEGATINVDSSLTISSPGDYTYSTNISSCPASGCCAIQIWEGPYGSIGDLVWADTDADGIKDLTENGLGGILVYLMSDPTTKLDSVVTNSSGLYKFDSLVEGTYYIKFSNGAYSFSPQDAGSDDELDSDAGANGLSQAITIDIFDDNDNPRADSDILRNNNSIDAGLLPLNNFDLALTKKLANPGVYTYGDTIRFDIQVTNQGDILATQVQLVDYVPEGFTLASSNWTMVGGVAKYDQFLSVAVGGTQTVEISFIIDEGAPQFISNGAEISAAKGPASSSVTDIDSTPDEDNSNDGVSINDEINQDGKNGGDEDDYDFETIEVQIPTGIFDLALRKTIGSIGPYEPGGSITFNLEIFNQGTMDANFIKVLDYFPSDLVLNDLNWLPNGNTARYIPDLSLAQGQSDQITITFDIKETASLGILSNSAEISATKGPSGEDVTDIDSTPDDDSTNDGTAINDEILEDGKNGGDEDDSDFEEFEITQPLVFDLSLAKVVASVGPFEPRDDVTFTISVTNEGDYNATNVEIIDRIPAGLVLNDNDWTSSGANAVLKNPINVAVGQTINVPITFTIDAGFNGTITNSAEIRNDKGPAGQNITDVDSNPNNNNPNEDDQDTATITVINPGIYDLALSKTLSSNGPFASGDQINFSILITNQGDQDAYGVRIKDTFPNGLTLTGPRWTLDGNTAIHDSAYYIPAGSEVTVSISFVINDSAIPGQLTNTSEIIEARDVNLALANDFDSTPNNNAPNEDDQDTAVFTVIQTASIGDFVWEDTDKDGIQDIGEVGIPNVQVRLERPSGSQVATTQTNGSGFYSFTNLAPGDYVVVFVKPTDYSATLANQGADNLDSDADPATGESTIITLTNGEVNESIDAGFFKAGSCSEVLAASAFDNSICVGETTSLSASSSDGTGINWYFGSVGGTAAFTTNSGESIDVSPVNNTTYYAGLATVASGCPSTRIPVTVTVNANPGTPTVNTPVEICDTETANLESQILSAASTTGGVFEWHVSNNPLSPKIQNTTAVGEGTYYVFEKSTSSCFSQSAQVTVNEKSCDVLIDISLIKIANARKVNTNDVVTYTITVDNDGPGDATNVVIQDILPTGLEFVSSNDFTYTNSDRKLSYNIAQLNANGSKVLTYQARVINAFGSIINLVEVVSADQQDIDSTPNNSEFFNEDDDDDEIINIVSSEPLADLSLEKFVSDISPKVGDLITYTVRVSNEGPNTATNVQVKDYLPDSVTYISSSGGNNISFDEASKTVTASFNSIAINGSAQFVIKATVNGTGTITNKAQVTASDLKDPDSLVDNGVDVGEDDDAEVSITVTNTCNPTTPVISVNDPYICLGQTAVLNALGCSGTVRWSDGQTGATINVSPTQLTTYTATCQVLTCVSNNSNAISIVVTNTPAPTVTANDQSICAGESVTLTSSGCTGTVAWSNGQTGNSITVTPAVTTTYTATCEVFDCVSPNSTPTVITVNDNSAAPVITSTVEAICNGGSATLSVSNCSGSIEWSNGATTQSITVSPLVNSTYSVICSAGNCSASANYTLKVGTAQTPVITADSSVLCVGASRTLTVTGCTGTILWSNGANTNSITVSPVATTTYTVNCGTECVGTASKIVRVSNLPAPTVTPTLTNVCPATTVDLADAITSSVTSELGNFVFRTGSSPTSPVVSSPNEIASSGSFYVFENSGSGCFSLGSKIDVGIIACEDTVDCLINPAIAIAGNDTTICLKENFFTLNGSISGAATSARWTSNGTGTFDNANNLVTKYNFTLADIRAGSVKMSLITNDPDGSGSCVADTSSFTITVNAIDSLPTITANKEASICLGDSLTLTVNQSANKYLWNTGDTTKSITVKAAGNYSVRLFNTAGCASLRSAEFEVSNSTTIPAPSVNDIAKNSCPEVTVDLTENVTSTPSDGGVFEYRTGMFITSALVEDPSKVNDGTYYVFDKSVSGCYSNPSAIKVAIDNCTIDTTDADVAIVITGDKGAVTIGDQVTYTITVTNNGPEVATNVTFENQIPGGIDIIGDTPGLTKAGDYLLATIPSLAVGESKTFTYTAIIRRSGLISNTTKIIAHDQNDPIKSNNFSKYDVECSTCQEICIATALSAKKTPLDDGTFNVTFTSLLEDCGNTDLDSLELTFDMKTMFGNTATYAMVQSPAVNAGSALVPNPNFNGSTDKNILIRDSSKLGTVNIDTVRWTINITPNGDLGPFYGNTFATGSSRTLIGTNTSVTDVSNDGEYIDHLSATPTRVRLFKEPGIGLALAIIDTTYNGDETWDVTYQAIVKNTGEVDLDSVLVSDSLILTYASPIEYTMVGVPTLPNGSTLAANPDYNGNTDANLTLASSTLAVGVTDTIWFTVRVKPLDKTEFTNQALAIGTGTLEDDTREVVKDISNTGYDPEVGGINPTILIIVDPDIDIPTITDPCLGVALYVENTEKLDDATIDVTYTALIYNCGGVTLSNISLCDSLEADFGAPTQVTLKKAPTVGTGSKLVINSIYDGINNTCMLDSTLSSLESGKIDTVRWTVNLTLNSNNGPFRKNVTVSALTPSDSLISDISNDGKDPSPEGEAPTVLNFNNLPDDLIGIAKELVSIESVSDKVFDLKFVFTLKNYGIIDFTGVQIQDNLALTFGDNIGIDSVKVFDPSEGLTVNENFTGKGLLINLLNDTLSTLPTGSTKTVSLFARVDMTEADTAKFENMALAIGYFDDNSTDDQSTDGNNPDPESDGTPLNNSIPTPIDFSSLIDTGNDTPLGIAKAVSDTVSIADGSYQVTYTVVVKNYGDTLLTNVQMTDSLSTVFGDSTDYALIGLPTLSSADSVRTLTLNTNFDGITDLNMFIADSSTLAAGATDTLTFKVKVRNNSSGDITYNNTIYGTANLGSEIVTDMSHAGLNPDEDGNNNPGNDNTPTALTLPRGENTGNNGGGVLIPGGISPNGDGLNDVLVIEGISESDEVSFRIYNRWGELVYKTDNYKRSFPGPKDGWAGVSNTGIRPEKGESKLPDGTYYYSAESPVEDLFERKPYVNFITISGGTRN